MMVPHSPTPGVLAPAPVLAASAGRVHCRALLQRKKRKKSGKHLSSPCKTEVRGFGGKRKQ
jgi:hypothetical protein